MWIFDVISTSITGPVIHSVVLGGLVMIAFNKVIGIIPVVSTALMQYRPLIQFLGIFVFVIGVFFEGALHTEVHWKQKVAEQEQKVKEAESKSQNINSAISSALAKRNADITGELAKLSEKIDKNKELMNSKCIVDPVVIEVLNGAARK